MTDNEIKREQPSFEVRAESLKKRTKEFLSTYENPSGSEDRLEICLIREGYRAVLMAEEEINRQKAEIERLEANLKEAFAEIEALKQINLHCKVESVKEFAERLKEKVESYDVYDGYKITIRFAVEEDTIDNLVKEMVGEG